MEARHNHTFSADDAMSDKFESIDQLMHTISHGEVSLICHALASLECKLADVEFRTNFVAIQDSVSLLLSVLASPRNEDTFQNQTSRNDDSENREVTPEAKFRSSITHAARCLAQLTNENVVLQQIRTHGGVPILLSCLRDMHPFDGSNTTVSNEASTKRRPTSGHTRSDKTMQWIPIDETNAGIADQLAQRSAVCRILGDVALEEFAVQSMTRGNGIFLVAQHLRLRAAPSRKVTSWTEITSNKQRSPTAREKRSVKNARPTVENQSHGQSNGLYDLHKHVFRVLRRLFRFERNRRLIKSLLPASLLLGLVEIPSLEKNGVEEGLAYYDPLVDQLQRLEAEDVARLIEGLSACDLTIKSTTHRIREYEIVELLGTGAFGQVYKAHTRKQENSEIYAIKEVNTTQACFGRTAQERKECVGRVLNEVKIIKQQLRHPNIVRYYKTFLHEDRLYIVMQLIDGLALTELIDSMKEREEYFTESRVWNMFIQLLLAIRYLHRDKPIVHRDLSSNNIMVGEGDKVTITDFGLARQKQWDTSKMMSSVGTLVYSCPEIVQSLPYSEGADIWSLGCVLYQLCTHTPPFQADCILTVASRIVESKYEPVAHTCPDRYSNLIDRVIKGCLTADAQKRPDIIEVASYLTDPLLKQLDSARQTVDQAKRRLRQFRDQTKLSSSLSPSSKGDIRLSTSDEHHIKTSMTESNCSVQTGPISAENTDFTVSPSDHGPLLLSSSTSQAIDTRCLLKASSVNYNNMAFSSPAVTRGTACSPSKASVSDETDGTNSRPVSARGVSISQKRLRQIEDPILNLVEVIQKLTHLSHFHRPIKTSHRLLGSLAIGYIKRLFAAGVAPLTVKHELFQLARRSLEPVSCAFLPSNGMLQDMATFQCDALPQATIKALSELQDISDSGFVSYELIVCVVDRLLRECTEYFTKSGCDPQA